MIDRILALPWGWAFLFLWVSVMGRANGTYWIGRAVAAGTGRTRWAGVLTSAAYARAQHLAERWGVLAVPLSFLTVGTQSLVQLSAGVSRMPLRLYLPAVSVGCAIWAAIYSTVGLAVFATWMEAGGWWAVAVVVALAALIISLRRRSASSPVCSREPECAPGTAHRPPHLHTRRPAWPPQSLTMLTPTCPSPPLRSSLSAVTVLRNRQWWWLP